MRSPVLEKKSSPNKKRDRYRMADSEWVASFSCSHLKILIVCRGPIRKEAMDVFEDLGADYGILMSEKDSVSYAHTLAPELRIIKDQDRIHRVVDYTGASGEERKERIQQIINIARENRYTHIFAGYGFMAEDAEFVTAIEEAGVGFIGPASNVHRRAGSKDTAKILARQLNVSVTPGVDNITALTLLDKVGKKKAALEKLASDKGLTVDFEGDDLEVLADRVLYASYKAGVGILTLEDLQNKATEIVDNFLKESPGSRFRLKYIGGGGGKGQRIVSRKEDTSDAVFQVLNESRAMGDADNRNFLIELNVETTRHNEIQLIGNGEWSLALGGRDCSLQMHEQKLVELSITDELYSHEIQVANSLGSESYAAALEKDRKLLKDMEDQAERFGQAVGLNSASTFECIVSGDAFYFMEMNTRIQVEHRVTEMAYTLRFDNPHNENDFFVVESLVETMVLLAVHGSRLPKPVRVPNNRAGGEVRLNATDDVLKPHAGGLIEYWSAPVNHEIRDDQGIGLKNPDTGWFIKYHLAGAYDSNIALIVSYGSGRRENLERLGDILRQMEIRGQDLKTNQEFHYGLINFTLGLHPMLKPDTAFVVPYLSAVGSLALEFESIDIPIAWEEYSHLVNNKFGADAQATLLPKQTFITRPLSILADNPHLTIGFLIYHYNRSFSIENGNVIWKRNPLRMMNSLYHYLRLEWRNNTAPSRMIWDHDQDLLTEGMEFYEDLESALGIDTEAAYKESVRSCSVNESDLYGKLDQTLLVNDGSNPFKTGAFGIKSDNISDELFQECQAAHLGWQLGLRLFEVFLVMGASSGIFEFHVKDDLTPHVPDRFKDPELRKEYFRHLSPPPKASANEIVAVSGGMFYSKETPQSPAYLEQGQHFEVGDPIYIIEVMKMFNKVYAEFSGTVEEVLLEGDAGVVVKKGDTLFRVKPDEEIIIESEEDRRSRIMKKTHELVSALV